MTEDLIFDVGMHNGDDTAYYLSLGYRVVAVEANPVMASEGSTRFAPEVASGQLTICHVGIGPEEGEAPFFLNELNSEWNSFNVEITSRGQAPVKRIEIPTCRFGSLLNTYGVPYYLKIDIEGHDHYCLEDISTSDIPRFISIEMSQVRGLQLLEQLHRLGYTKFKIISQQTHLPVQMEASQEQAAVERARRMLKSKRWAARIVRSLGGRQMLQRQVERPRRDGNWIFPPGSSGRFGNATLGQWQSFEEICETYRHFRQLADAGQPSIFWGKSSYSFWADFHATHD